MKIKTNHVPRYIVAGYELSEKERAEFDYLNDEELHCGSFIRYRGWTYDLGDVMRVEPSSSFYTLTDAKKWHGYVGDSFFSGVLFRMVGDDQVICGTYYS